MKNVKKFEEFINEGFVHSGLSTLDSIIDLRDYDFLYDASKESVKNVNKLLRDSKFMKIRLFHGTSPNINILDDGLLVTKNKTKKSIQSEVGYTYLSIYPDSAKTFGNIAYGITNSIVYEIVVPIIHLKCDKDQIFNVNLYGDKNANETLGDSAIYGHGFRIKGDIPPYMISKTDF
jgi:hypothetical protein